MSSEVYGLDLVQEFWNLFMKYQLRGNLDIKQIL